MFAAECSASAADSNWVTQDWIENAFWELTDSITPMRDPTASTKACASDTNGGDQGRSVICV